MNSEICSLGMFKFRAVESCQYFIDLYVFGMFGLVRQVHVNSLYCLNFEI